MAHTSVLEKALTRPRHGSSSRCTSESDELHRRWQLPSAATLQLFGTSECLIRVPDSHRTLDASGSVNLLLSKRRLLAEKGHQRPRLEAPSKEFVTDPSGPDHTCVHTGGHTFTCVRTVRTTWCVYVYVVVHLQLATTLLTTLSGYL